MLLAKRKSDKENKAFFMTENSALQRLPKFFCIRVFHWLVDQLFCDKVMQSKGIKAQIGLTLNVEAFIEAYPNIQSLSAR